jgi:hypothetical protein
MESTTPADVPEVRTGDVVDIETVVKTELSNSLEGMGWTEEWERLSE